MMTKIENIEVFVNERYSKVAKMIESGDYGGCCDTSTDTTAIPSLGCDRNLLKVADPKFGETVVDLGSGPGKDVLAVAALVGDAGRVIGIDFSDDMLRLARKNAEIAGTNNVEFKKGKIDAIPLDDGVSDLVISNCVINLVEDKQKVFDEAYRVLRKGGRLVVSDMISDEIDPEILDPKLYCACVGGATSVESYKTMLSSSGFDNIQTITEDDGVVNYLEVEIAYQSVLFIAEKT